MSLEQLRTIKGYDNYIVSSWGKVYATRVVWKATQLIDSTEVFYPDSVRQGYMNNAFKIVRDCLMEDINEIQAEIFNEFTGNIKGLMEQIKESEDDA